VQATNARPVNARGRVRRTVAVWFNASRAVNARTSVGSIDRAGSSSTGPARRAARSHSHRGIERQLVAEGRFVV
jgi:hypothetical protein